MRILIACLLLLTSCMEIDFKKAMQGKWVNINDSSITLEIKDNGPRMAYRYKVTNYVIDTTTDEGGDILSDTFVAPFKGIWLDASYDEKRGFIFGADSSRISYLEGVDGLEHSKERKVLLFVRSKK
jgi:hypothetical protein